jgi:nucleotide-binding universal stress UspA family protein
MNSIKKILVPTDFSDSSMAAMRMAISLGVKESADILVLHVGSAFQTWEVFDEAINFNPRVHNWEIDRLIKERHLDLNRFLDKHIVELHRVPQVRKRVVLGDVG